MEIPRRRIIFFALILLAAFLLIEAGFSLQWPITHDEAPLFYEAYLMRAEGRVPYRDLFDFQMPGSYAAFYWLGLLSGWGAFRIRVLDLALLAALAIVTFLLMRGFGKATALAAALLFGLEYLEGGPSMSLQREYLLLVPITLAVWIFMRGELTAGKRMWIGLFFGLASAFKPHAALGLIPILLFDIADLIERRGPTPLKDVAGSILPALTGFLLPAAVTILWLARKGALVPFLEIALNYWPLYAQINGQLVVNAGGTRLLYLADQAWRLGGGGLWLIPGLVGVSLVPPEQKRRAYLLAGMALCYAIYPAFSGQFFPYHYIPFVYFGVALASLSLQNNGSITASRFAVFVFLLAAFLNIRPSTAFVRQLEGKSVVTPTDRAGGMARFLEKNLAEGDTVQPLDWTGGTLLAMLETRARLATSFVFDFYFYHHVSHPYIQSLRARFMDELRSSPPRFIIEVTAVDKPWVAGADAGREFPELRAFLDENYFVTVQKEDYVIYERR